MSDDERRAILEAIDSAADDFFRRHPTSGPAFAVMDRATWREIRLALNASLSVPAVWDGENLYGAQVAITRGEGRVLKFLPAE